MKDFQQFLEGLYLNSIQSSQRPQYTPETHKQQILSKLKTSKITNKHITQLLLFSKWELIADLLQIAKDYQKVKSDLKINHEKAKIRARMHFNGETYKQIYKDHECLPNRHSKRVLSMYQGEDFYWNMQTQNQFIGSLLKNTIYFPGIIKGNGVLFNKNCIATCAHVILEEKDTENNHSKNQQKNTRLQSKFCSIKCFINGLGEFGLVRFFKDGLYQKQDVAFGQIIHFKNDYDSFYSQTILATFDSNKLPFPKCIQIGLLYSQEENNMETFETNAGFIQRNLYQDQTACQLSEQMGLLIHNCYGLWGTSGSPLWNKHGHLIGIHNAWNQNSRNITMIIHEESKSSCNSCRAIKQYERRAISAHVLKKLFNIYINNILQQEQIEARNQQQQKKIRQVKAIARKIKKNNNKKYLRKLQKL